MNSSQSIMQQQSSRGFSLFELLIALLVMSIGLLGLAQLQSTGIRNNDSASQRTLATFLAADIADRMRANMRLTTGGGSLAQNYADLATDYAINTTGGAPTDPGCGNACSAAQRPAQDAYDWAVNGVQALLPGGQAIVAQNGGFFEITIMWDDNRTGATGTACGGDPDVDLTCFQTLFLP